MSLDEWEKVDVGQNYASGGDKSCPTTTATKTEGVLSTQDHKRTSTRETRRDDCSLPKSSWEAVGTFDADAPSWKYTGTQENNASWGSLGAQPSSKTRALHFHHPKQYGAFPRRYPYGEILSGYEQDVSSIRDGFTDWVKSDPETILRRHVANVTRACAEFREAPARKQSPSSQGYHFDKNMPHRSTEQTRLSVCSWNRGPRRGKEGATERHIAGKWHIITSQEAIEYLEHDFLTNRFHVTHYGGCAVFFFFQQGYLLLGHQGLFNLSPRHQSEKDKITEGESGWVTQGVVSKAAFRRQPRSGQETFTVMSLHINSNYAKKR